MAKILSILPLLESMLFLGLIKKMGNFFYENLDDTAPIGNQLSSYPGIKDTQVSEKYL